MKDLPGGYESAFQCRGHGFDPWSRKIPHIMKWQSQCAPNTEPTHLSLRAATSEVHMPSASQQEKPPRWEAHATQQKGSSHLLQLEKAQCSQKIK